MVIHYHGGMSKTLALTGLTTYIALLSGQVMAIQFNYSSVPDSDITFTGTGSTANITFGDDSFGNNFQIDAVFGGTGSATGYTGEFNGVWTMGPVTTVTPVPLVQTAPITGIGSFSIFDGTQTLTGTLALSSAGSLTGATVNINGLLGTISNLAYAGSDPDLLAFAAPGSGFDVLSFTFPSPGKSLSDLVAPGVATTTFSGNLITRQIPLPESAQAGFVGGSCLLGLGAYRMRRRAT